tara:strand:+ start:1324 stop:1545 length:222 start_codon:yes stop_codon:yes gene_type:complete
MQYGDERGEKPNLIECCGFWGARDITTATTIRIAVSHSVLLLKSLNKQLVITVLKNNSKIRKKRDWTDGQSGL